ncbi:phage major capsid family protein [Haematobacter genomosp. 1]|nr:phage major capsid protein [Haematobacter genomosp. 1]
MGYLKPSPDADLEAFAWVVKAQASQQAGLGGLVGAPERSLLIAKAAVTAGRTTNPQWAGALADWSGLTTTFIQSLRGRSIFVSLLEDDLGMTRAPMRTRAAAVTLRLPAGVNGEGLPIPVGAFTVAGAVLQPFKAVTLMVMTSEMISASGDAGLALLLSEMQTAVSEALDAEFLLRAVTGAIATYTSSGTTAVQITADLRKLLTAVNGKPGASIVFAAGPDVLNGLATTTTTTGALAFPTVTPQGGELLGRPVFVSTGLSSTLLALDARGFVGDIGEMELHSSQNADVVMDDAPPSVPNASSVLTSMWQTNSTAYKVISYAAAQRVRDDAVASITGFEFDL